MKKTGMILKMILLCAVLVFSVNIQAKAAGNRLVDNADILTQSEEADVLSELNAVSQKLNFDVVVFTVETLDGRSAVNAAETIYDNGGYSGDGVILLISMEDSAWCITATGYGTNALNENARDKIGRAVQSELSAGEFASAFITFAQQCEERVSLAQSGEEYREPFDFLKTVVIGFVISFIVGLIVTGSMAGQLKSVHMQTAAAEYVKKDSLKLAASGERFLYKKLDKKERASSSTQNGNSGHSSTTGKF